MKHDHHKEQLAEYLQALIEGKYTLQQVASLTGYTREHICRLKKRFKEEGEACLVNGHKGKPGPRTIPQEIKDKIVSIYKEHFIIDGVCATFARFQQELEEKYGISSSYRAVYDVLTSAGIQSPEKRGANKSGRPRHTRARRVSPKMDFAIKGEHHRERLAEYLQALIEGKYTLRQVASFTGYTREHLCRLKKRFKEEGEACLVNGHKGMPSPTAIPQEIKDKIVSIYKEHFIIDGVGINFTAFCDWLKEKYGISYSYRAISNMLTSEGIQSPKKRGIKKPAL